MGMKRPHTLSKTSGANLSPKITRFRTTLKVQFQGIMQALVHNCKTLISVTSVPIALV